MPYSKEPKVIFIKKGSKKWIVLARTFKSWIKLNNISETKVNIIRDRVIFMSISYFFLELLINDFNLPGLVEFQP